MDDEGQGFEGIAKGDMYTFNFKTSDLPASSEDRYSGTFEDDLLRGGADDDRINGRLGDDIVSGGTEMTLCAGGLVTMICRAEPGMTG